MQFLVSPVIIIISGYVWLYFINVFVLFITIDSDNNYIEKGIGGVSNVGSPYAKCIIRDHKYSVPSVKRWCLLFRNKESQYTYP